MVPLVIIRTEFLLRKAGRQWKYQSNKVVMQNNMLRIISVASTATLVPYMLTTSELTKEHAYWLKSDPLGDCIVSLRNYAITLLANILLNGLVHNFIDYVLANINFAHYKISEL